MIGVGAGWWLAAARLFALLRAQAAPRAALGPVWPVLAAALALLMAPMVAADAAGATVGGADFLLAVGFELLLGTVLGAFAALAGHALIGGAQVSAAALLPANRGGALVLLTVCLALGLGLGFGMHRPLLAALVDLGERFPVGAPGRWLIVAPDLAGVVGAARSATVLALGLATPVLLVHLVFDALTGLTTGPGSSQTTAHELVGGWVRLALCLLALSAAWLTFPEAWGSGWGTL